MEIICTQRPRTANQITRRATFVVYQIVHLKTLFASVQQRTRTVHQKLSCIGSCRSLPPNLLGSQEQNCCLLPTFFFSFHWSMLNVQSLIAAEVGLLSGRLSLQRNFMAVTTYCKNQNYERQAHSLTKLCIVCIRAIRSKLSCYFVSTDALRK
jgi:hypothetical protein